MIALRLARVLTVIAQIDFHRSLTLERRFFFYPKLINIRKVIKFFHVVRTLEGVIQ